MSRNRWLSLTRHAAALLALGAFCSLGCVVSNEIPRDRPTGKGPDTLATPVDSIDVPRACPLDGSDLRSVGWPQDFATYSLFTCTSSMSAVDVTRIHQGLPGSRALAYMSAQEILIGFYPGNPYYDSLTAIFDSTLCVMDLRTGRVVRQGRVPYPVYVLSKKSADILVAFHRDRTMAAGWDGLFIDNCTLAYPPWRKALLDSLTPDFDIDGDGVADSMDKLDAQYSEGRPYFTRRLREELGDNKLLVANAGGPLVDSYLNGITLEGVGERFTVPEARSYLQGQLAVTHTPFVAVLWITTDESRTPSLELAREIPGVHYGTATPGH